MNYLLALLVIARAAFGQQPCTLDGRVIDQTTGRPVAKVHLFVMPERLGPAIRTNTNEQGVFCFARLDAGSYRLLAQRGGYLDAAYPGTRLPGSYVTFKIDPSNHAAPLTLKMVQRSILPGRVVDADGDPIAGAEVDAIGPDGEPAMRRMPGNIAATDTRGVFRFYDLDPGTYRLLAVPRLEARSLVGYRDSHGQPLPQRAVDTYYPNSPSGEGAAPIVLTPGHEITGIDITVQSVGLRHVSGRVVGMPFGKYLLADLKRPSGGVEGRAIQLREDGTFYQDGLLPGLYTFRLSGAADRTVDLTVRDVDGLVIEPLKTDK